MTEPEEASINKEVDARQQKCPIPILWAKKALAGMDSGQVLRVLATDPAAVGDFRFFTQQTGHELLRQTEEAGEYTITLRKK